MTLFAAIGIGVWLASFAIEALRPKPKPPTTFVGNRPGQYRAFISLLRNAASWEDAAKDYGRIEIPVLLVWGDRDWATPEERERDRKRIPGVEIKTLERGGHFLPLDRPRELSELIVRFAGA